MKMDTIRLIAGLGNSAVGIVDGPTVDLPLPGVDTPGPFVLRSADGLGPTDLGLRLLRSTLEVGTYRGRSPALRQLVLAVGLQPNYRDGQTSESLRTQLYSLLTTRFNLPVGIQLMHDGAIKATAKGYVSRMEPSYFTKDPVVVVTIDCDSAYFDDPVERSITPTIRPFEGPVNGVNWRSFDVVNEGTAPANFLVSFVFGAAVPGTSLILADEIGGGGLILIDNVTWAAGDRLTINTYPNVRNVYKTPAGGTEQVSILNNVNRGASSWLELHSGTNRFMLSTSNYSIPAAYPFRYRPRYWGV